jgi:hypothetical protein
VVLKLEPVPESPRGLAKKHRFLGTGTRVSDSAGKGKMRFSISNNPR